MHNNLYKLTKLFDEVIVIDVILSRHHQFDVLQQLKKWEVVHSFYGSTDFQQTYVIFRQLSIVSFEIKK